MTAVVRYFDLDVWPESLLTDVRRNVDGHRAMVVRTGSLAGGDIGPAQFEFDAKHPEYLAAVGDWLGEVFAYLAAAAPQAFLYRGTSLLELVRCELMSDIAEPLHPWYALTRIGRRHADSTIEWIHSRPKTPALLIEELRKFGLVVVPSRVTERSGDAGRGSWWRTRIRRLAELAEAACNRAEKLSDLTPIDVLFTDFFPNSVTATLPIADRLRQFGLTTQWLAARRSVYEAVKSSEPDCLQLTDLVSIGVHWSSRLTGRRRRAIRAAINTLPESVLFATGAFPAARFAKELLIGRLLPKLAAAAFWLEGYGRILERLRPRAVVGTSYSGIAGRAAALAARSGGAKSIYVQHGLLPAYRVWFEPFLHDLALVWGEYDRRSFANWHRGPTTAVVTGSTLYESQRAESGRRYGLLTNKKRIVTYLASRSGGAMVSEPLQTHVISLLVDSAARLGYELRVKPHPGDRTGLIRRLRERGYNFQIVERPTAAEAISEADLLVVVSSTTGLETCAAGKPLVVLLTGETDNAVPYHEYGAALSVVLTREDAAKQLLEALRSAIESQSTADGLMAGRRALIDDMLAGGDGQAASRAASLIAKVVAASPAPSLAS